MEALVRWQDPERGLVPPAEFIPVAELSGLILPIGRWMLHEACAEAARLGERDGRPPRVSVNVSGRQLVDPGLVSAVESALVDSGLPANRLQLELTESILIQDLEAGVALMERLKNLGVTLALDDFGTGYSSLSYLKQLPFDVIKIDRSFVRGLPDCREDLAIVSAVISFAGALGMDVLAEGVETADHVRALLELGCDHAQGFHFHRPLDPDVIRALWRA
jgi:EAL domain-containing protein (putative c-di-GMP-specific phosphodiesterase class I)